MLFVDAHDLAGRKRAISLFRSHVLWWNCLGQRRVLRYHVTYPTHQDTKRLLPTRTRMGPYMAGLVTILLGIDQQPRPSYPCTTVPAQARGTKRLNKKISGKVRSVSNHVRTNVGGTALRPLPHRRPSDNLQLLAPHQPRTKGNVKGRKRHHGSKPNVQHHDIACCPPANHQQEARTASWAVVVMSYSRRIAIPKLFSPGQASNPYILHPELDFSADTTRALNLVRSKYWRYAWPIMRPCLEGKVAFHAFTPHIPHRAHLGCRISLWGNRSIAIPSVLTIP